MSPTSGTSCALRHSETPDPLTMARPHEVLCLSPVSRQDPISSENRCPSVCVRIFPEGDFDHRGNLSFSSRFRQKYVVTTIVCLGRLPLYWFVNLSLEGKVAMSQAELWRGSGTLKQAGCGVMEGFCDPTSRLRLSWQGARTEGRTTRFGRAILMGCTLCSCDRRMRNPPGLWVRKHHS